VAHFGSVPQVSFIEMEEARRRPIRVAVSPLFSLFMATRDALGAERSGTPDPWCSAIRMHLTRRDHEVFAPLTTSVRVLLTTPSHIVSTASRAGRTWAFRFAIGSTARRAHVPGGQNLAATQRAPRSRTRIVRSLGMRHSRVLPLSVVHIRHNSRTRRRCVHMPAWGCGEGSRPGSPWCNSLASGGLRQLGDGRGGIVSRLPEERTGTRCAEVKDHAERDRQPGDTGRPQRREWIQPSIMAA
jgi:hypothetical protein